MDQAEIDEKLWDAVINDRVDYAKHLIQDLGANANCKNATERCPLSAASSPDMILLLIDVGGADVNAQDMYFRTAMFYLIVDNLTYLPLTEPMWPMCFNPFDCLKVLVWKGATIPPIPRDMYSNPALYLTRQRSRQVIMYLMAVCKKRKLMSTTPSLLLSSDVVRTLAGYLLHTSDE